MSEAIILSVIAHLAWTVGNLLNVKLSRTITPLQTVLWQTIFLVFLLLPITVFRPVNLTLSAVAFTSLLAVSLYGGSLLFYTALSKGSAQISGAITATAPALIAILSVIFLQSILSGWSVLIIAAITFGLLLVSWPKKGLGIDISVGYSAGAVVLWAIYYTFISKSIDKLGPYWANYISVLSGAVLLLIYGFIQGQVNSPKMTKNSMRLVLLSAVFIGGAPLAYNLALEHASPAVVAPITGSYAALFIVASSIIFKDKINGRQWLGVIISILAVIIFSIVNS